jgi:hypothetical protein
VKAMAGGGLGAPFTASAAISPLARGFNRSATGPEARHSPAPAAAEPC